jgi:thiamine biosynthesis lipoprotein
MNPSRGGPLTDSPASVTVLTASCMEADAWATALMVSGQQKGMTLAEKNGLSALFIRRDGSNLRQVHIGWENHDGATAT